MSHYTKLLWILCLALLSACSQSSIPDEAELSINIGQTALGLSCAQTPMTASTQHLIDENGVQRSFLVNYPTARNAALPAALYVGIHGAGGSSASIQQKNIGFCTGTQWVAIYPQGVYQGPPQSNIGWNVNPESVDEHFIDAAVAWAEATYSIDTSKVRAYGFSMGSLMSVLLGLTRPGVYGAIGVVCGEIPWTMSAPYPTTPLSLYQTSGDRDMTFSSTLARALHDQIVANDGGLISTSAGYNADCHFYEVAGGQLVEWCEHPTTGHTWTLNDTLGLSDYFTRLGL